MLHLLCCPIKYSAAINVFTIILRHCLRPRFRREDSVVTIVFQLWQEEIVELVRFDLLQANNVRGIMSYLVEDPFFPIFPIKRPTWTITVHLSSCVLVTQYIITHHCEYTWNRNKTNLYSLENIHYSKY